MADALPRRRRSSAVVAEVLSVLGTVALVAWLPFLTRQGRWPLTALVAIALLLGSASVLVDLLVRPRRADADVRDEADDDCILDDSTDDPLVTAIVVLGDEPVELQRTSVLLCQEAGPTVVVSTRPIPDEIADAGVEAHVAEDPGEALRHAIDGVTTDAVLLLSGRAAPLPGAADAIAATMGPDDDWVVGHVRPFNRDGYVSAVDVRIDHVLRARARGAGTLLWEPNATLVRTAALRDRPFTDRRPRGAWMRAVAADGRRGGQVDRTVAVVAAPAGSRSYWPEALAQQRGAAADAADAARSERGRPRLVAALLLARESTAWSLPIWLAVLFTGTISGQLPFLAVHGVVPALLGAVLLLRWIGLHRSIGVPLRPLVDLRAALYRVPGSLAALPSAIVGRVLPGPRRLSIRPLLWAGVLIVAILGTALVDHTPDRRMTAPAVGAALLTLVLLWGLCIQVLVQRGWDRTTFRVMLRRPVRLDGVTATTIDGSPDGLAVALGGPDRADAPAVPAVGESVRVRIDLQDGTTIGGAGTVMWRSPHVSRLGLRLALDADAARAWSSELLRAARPDRTRRTDRPAGGRVRASGASGSRRTTVLDVAGICLTVVLSVALLTVLGAAMLGLQAAVVRSASMTPNIAQGSVVVTESVPVADLRAGDVVTRPASSDREALTHRIVATGRHGDDVSVRTRGDANDTSETWSVPAGTSLQRVRWVVPGVGQIVSAARSNLGVVIGVALAAGLVVVAVRMPTRRRTAPTLAPV